LTALDVFYSMVQCINKQTPERQIASYLRQQFGFIDEEISIVEGVG
jgi:hypothetical protein